MNERLTLSELHEAIKDILYGNFQDKYWIVAEISQLSENKGGHCYLELIEKNKQGKTIAKTRATIWSFSYQQLKYHFSMMVNENLKAGMKVLILASVEFHEVYGFSLNITDLDPTYTLGDQEKRRQEIINQLEEEGIFNMNKELELPIVPQKIAVISSASAAGYGDFMNQLNSNSYGYVFYTKLFQANMQGDSAENSITEALDEIANYIDFFDAVVLIRGGGSKEELSCFDSYLIASYIAQFPLPVLTGIGHERDESIADLVAHKKLKTPTAVAEFLIEQLAQFNAKLETTFLQIKANFDTIISSEKSNLQSANARLQPLLKNLIASQKTRLKFNAENIKVLMNKVFAQEKFNLSKVENQISVLSKNYYLSQNLSLKQSKDQIFKLINLKLKIENEKIILSTEKIKKLSLISMQKENTKLKSYSKILEIINPEQVIKRGYALLLKNGKIISSSKNVATGDILHIKMKDGELISEVLQNLS